MADAAELVVNRAVLERTRILPLPGEVLVRRGQRVSPDTVVAKAEFVPGEPYVIDLNTELKARLTPDEVRGCLRVRLGDSVEVGETLAARERGIFGERLEARAPVSGTIEFISWTRGRLLVREDARSADPIVVVNVSRRLDVPARQIRTFLRYREGDEVRQGAALAAAPGDFGGMEICYAPVSGIIQQVCTNSGVVRILRPHRPSVVEAYLSGVVSRIIPEQGAVIRTEAAHVQGTFGVGFETHGKLLVLVRSPGDTLSSSEIDENCRGAVMVSGAWLSYETMQRALELGVRGLVTGGVDYLDIVRLAGSAAGVGITGQEDLAMTVMVAEGFGRMPMNPSTFQLLQAYQGRVVSLNGATQVRAGVIRPELVIPLEAGDQPKASAGQKRARIIGGPYRGRWGRVIGRLPELKLENEMKAPGVRVELSGGEIVTVSEPNLEIIY